MFDYYNINIMSVQKYTQFRTNKIQYLTPAGVQKEKKKKFKGTGISF